MKILDELGVDGDRWVHLPQGAAISGRRDGVSHPTGTAGRSSADSPLTWWQIFPGDKAQLAGVRHWLESLFPACEARDDLVAVASHVADRAIEVTRPLLSSAHITPPPAGSQR